MINGNNVYDKTDTKKKDSKPDTKKKDSKPDTKKKNSKPDTKKKKDSKPYTKKKKKDSKPDKSKNNTKNMISNRIKYEIQDIAKYRKVLIKMIDDRMYMLELTNMQLAKSIDYTDTCENVLRFNELCHANRIIINDNYKLLISELYAVNKALECLRDGAGNRIWPKDINYDRITCIDNVCVKNYYYQIINEKKRLIKIAREEIEMVRRLIEINMYKYEKIIKGAGEMNIYALDRACADIDKTIGYIRKIIIMMPSIVEKIVEIRKRFDED